MRKILCFIAVFLGGAVLLNAQEYSEYQAYPSEEVLAGRPQPSVSQRQGLLLPHVDLDKDLTVFKWPLVLNDSIDKKRARGMVVYNTNPEVGEGVYIWNGIQWERSKTVRSTTSVSISESDRRPFATEVSISGPDRISSGTEVTFSAAIQPAGLSAYSVSWKIISQSGVSEVSLEAVNSNSVRLTAWIAGVLSGEVVIRATVSDGSREAFAEKTIVVMGFQSHDFGPLGVWMTENLRSSSMYCYNTIFFESEEAKKACPAGWSLPTETQWDGLLRYLIDPGGQGAESNLFFGSDPEIFGECIVSSSSPNGTLRNPNAGYWWASQASQYVRIDTKARQYDIFDYYYLPPLSEALRYYAVRCIKD
ncbi:MAG: hypothetical protein FWF52_01030 [Candidatus Azobacteroides sp.]|nr:hypothetical protein [Candidatus Azobacteroides sp.]